MSKLDPARLLAAAPDMLAVLKEIVAEYDDDQCRAEGPEITAARRAIAKAEGKR